MSEYIVGQIIVVSDLITNPVTDAPVQDATLTATVYKPDGTTETLTIAFPGAEDPDAYDAQFTPTQTGWHEYVFKSTGAGAGAGRGRFYVSPVP